MKWGPFTFIWRQPGGLPECPYFHRTILGVFGYSIRIHEWHADDDSRHFHDHPQWFWTFVLKGGYTDYSYQKGADRVSAGSLRYRPANFRHAVLEVIPGTITILLAGKPSRRWGFWVDGKLIKRDKYFATKGHHPCDPTDEPIRLKPGGERI